MRLVISLIAFAFSWNLHSAEPTRTYYLQIKGDRQVGNKLIKELSAEPCFTPSVLNEIPSQHPVACHAFRRFMNGGQITGNLDRKGSGLLYKVSIDAPRKFNLQIFQKAGNTLRRIVNAGYFLPKGDFYRQLVQTTRNLTFK